MKEPEQTIYDSRSEMEAEAFVKIVAILKPFNPETRARIVKALCAFMNIGLNGPYPW